MDERGWIAYFRKRLDEAEKELSDFRQGIAQCGLRVRHRDINGEQDVTEQELKRLEDIVEEYRRVLRDA
jgi:hypothetical protein